MIKTVRDLLSVLIVPVTIGWYALSVWLVKWGGVSIVETLGLGTVGGVFLKMASDTWQFHFRKRGSNSP